LIFMHADHDPNPAQIVAEIAERLVELESIRRGMGPDLIYRLNTLFRASPRGYEIVVEALTGNPVSAHDSFAVQGQRRGLTKQTIHVEWHVALDRVAAAGFEEVAEGLRVLRERVQTATRLAPSWDDVGEREDREAGFMTL
jgi:hypothetical protein